MNTAANVLLTAHTLYERSAGAADKNANRPSWYKIVGLLLALASGICIGISFVVKKVGLLQANKKYQQEAGEGYGYLKNWMWWIGMTLMIVGEIANFAAYIFLDAVVVVSLGCLSVVVTTVLSAIFLKERLSFVGKLGCLNCIIGSVIIAINAPEQSAVADIADMKKHVVTVGFLVYLGIVLLGCLFTIFWAGPRYGKKTMLVYLTVCSWIGGLSVVCTQGLGAAILAQTRGVQQFNQWFLYIVLVFVICTLLTEIIYLNKALNLFNAALVTPTYYVYFTTCTIISSAVLFQGFHGTAISITTVILGFLQICTGVVLLQLAKSSKDVPDTAVFKGDLDQVRTIAEQEEPEYEPRADTIRGSGALLRVISQRRARREAEEIKTIHNENMEPIGEDEVVEWDGLRRRKTVLHHGTPAQPGSLKRAKTLHPPLGMSKFPDENASDEDDDDIHPGFLPRFRRSSTRKSRRPSSPSPVPMTGIIVSDKAYPPSHDPSKAFQASREHVYGLPEGLRRPAQIDGQLDTIDHPSKSTEHVHWAETDPSTAPRPPPHAVSNRSESRDGQTARRAFSFQNMFHRQKSAEHRPQTGDAAYHESISPRPKSRGALSFFQHSHLSEKEDAGLARMDTEEERLGLVKGDSTTHIPDYLDSSPAASPGRPLMLSHAARLQREGEQRAQGDTPPRMRLHRSPSRDSRISDDWQITSQPSSAAHSVSPPAVSPPPYADQVNPALGQATVDTRRPGGPPPQVPQVGGGLAGLTSAVGLTSPQVPRRGYQRGRHIDDSDDDDLDYVVSGKPQRGREL